PRPVISPHDALPFSQRRQQPAPAHERRHAFQHRVARRDGRDPPAWQHLVPKMTDQFYKTMGGSVDHGMVTNDLLIKTIGYRYHLDRKSTRLNSSHVK